MHPKHPLQTGVGPATSRYYGIRGSYPSRLGRVARPPAGQRVGGVYCARTNDPDGRCKVVGRDLVTADPAVMMGKPVISGTRITVEMILEKLAAGESMNQVLDEHPRLTEETIRAALAFGAEALRADVTYPLREEAG